MEAGFQVEHVEDVLIEVMEARSDAELIEWTRVFGMNRLLAGLPGSIQRAWEAELVIQSEPYRRDGVVRLGGVTRLVAATASVVGAPEG